MSPKKRLFQLIVLPINLFWSALLSQFLSFIAPQNRLWVAVQSTLGFATMYIAANLDLATARALTDLRQYINSDLVFSNLKFRAVYSEITTVKVVIPSVLSLDLSKNCF